MDRRSLVTIYAIFLISVMYVPSARVQNASPSNSFPHSADHPVKLKMCNTTCLLYLDSGLRDVSEVLEECEEVGGRLPQLRSKEEKTFLEKFMKKFPKNVTQTLFIDLKRNKLEGFESVQSTNRKGHPLFSNKLGSFLEVYENSIRPVFSNIRRNFICKYKKEDQFKCAKCPCQNGECLEINEKSLNWYEARNRCWEKGGDLWDYQDYDIWKTTEIIQNRTLTHLLLGNSHIRWTRMDDQSGSFVAPTDWLGGYEDTDISDSKECVIVSKSNSYKWEAVECHTQRKVAVVCTKNLPEESPKPPDSLVLHIIIAALVVLVVLLVTSIFLLRRFPPSILLSLSSLLRKLRLDRKARQTAEAAQPPRRRLPVPQPQGRVRETVKGMSLYNQIAESVEINDYDRISFARGYSLERALETK